MSLTETAKRVVIQHLFDIALVAEIEIDGDMAEVFITDKKIVGNDTLQIITNASEYKGEIKMIRIRTVDGDVLMERPMDLDKTNQFGIVNAFTVKIKIEELEDGEFFDVAVE